jgi:feruloyl esterase
MGALEKGYAVAGTDTGHAGAGIDSTWAHGDMEKIANYGHAAVHRVTVAAKFLIERHYAASISRSYFAGCSNGGRQGLMSAQRYPEDFDGVIAGAPAIDFTAISASFINATRVNYPEPDNLEISLISWNESKMLGEAVLATCDGKDGIQDGIIADPMSCDFDIGALACKGKDTDQCLSKKELAALQSIYAGPRAKDRAVGYGYPFGGENHGYGWGAWLIGGKDIIAKGVPSLAYAYGVGFMRDFVMHDMQWNYPDMDFESLEDRARLVQATLSPTNAELSPFRNRGGKLLIYHGWADSGLSPYMSIDYANRVYERDERARDDVRLFLLPGVLHCSGGPGPDRIDYLDALDAWVTSGDPPDELTAAFDDGSGAGKVCAFPTKARLTGGDGKNPDQFACE